MTILRPKKELTLMKLLNIHLEMLHFREDREELCNDNIKINFIGRVL
jgi:hypothetical protein